VRTLADAVDDALQDAIGETRKAIMAATDQPAGESSIGDALARDVAQFSARFELPVTVRVEPVPRVDPDAQLELLRLTQEALRNVMKHANAGSASVVLRMRGTLVELSISDDGDGFDPALVSAAAYGLTTMRRRAELIGGQLEIHSAPRRGTQVRVRFQPGGGIPDAAGRSRRPERLDERPLLSDRLVGG
jgi:signal transduction histidine kinase